MASKIAQKILNWYVAGRRSLPWRDDPQPYAVWVAEVMAQQTRLESMIPFYQRWMQRYPDVASLAAAGEQDVLVLWEGLGYYTRARNLHRAAQILVKDFGGQLPETTEDLRRLPGIGAYTAGAIASLAFGLDEPAVDGNAIRVLSRLFNVDSPVGSQPATDLFWDLARQHLPAGKAAEFNQALMDLGAWLCTPRNPACDACPLIEDCAAQALGIQLDRPVRLIKAPIPQHRFAAAVIEDNGKLLVMRRAPQGLLGGMWEFPNTQLEDRQTHTNAICKTLRNLGFEVTQGPRLAMLQHAYSHFRISLSVYRFNLVRGYLGNRREYKWVSRSKLNELPMGKLDRQIAAMLFDDVG